MCSPKRRWVEPPPAGGAAHRRPHLHAGLEVCDQSARDDLGCAATSASSSTGSQQTSRPASLASHSERVLEANTASIASCALAPSLPRQTGRSKRSGLIDRIAQGGPELRLEGADAENSRRPCTRRRGSRRAAREALVASLDRLASAEGGHRKGEPAHGAVEHRGIDPRSLARLAPRRPGRRGSPPQAACRLPRCPPPGPKAAPADRRAHR